MVVSATLAPPTGARIVAGSPGYSIRLDSETAPHTTQGVMVGDYISTSFLAGQQRVVDAFAIGFPPPAPGQFNEPMFSALEKLRGGTNSAGKSSTVFSGGAPDICTTF